MVEWMINRRNSPFSRGLCHEARDLIICTCKDENLSKYIKFLFYSHLIQTRKELLPMTWIW